MTHCVYRHIRLDTNEVFYVGLAKLGSKRPYVPNSRNKYWQNVVDKNAGKFKVDIILRIQPALKELKNK